MSLWMHASVAVTLLLQGTTRRIRATSKLGPLRVWARTHSPVSTQDASEVTDYYNKQYAFVVKYQMAKIVGVEYAHTSLVVCSKAEFQDHIDKFEEWCTPVRGKSPEGCWKASSRWSNTWTPKAQESLQTSMEQRSYYGGMSSCTEYEFAGDDGTGQHDPGIQIIKFGESTFFKELRRRQMDALMGGGSKLDRWRNWALEFIVDSKQTMEVYPVGPVDKDAVSKASQNVRSSGSGFNFNPYTYQFLQHNCHHFTEAMLLLLKLPYWNPAGGLPSSFMPEDSKKNPVLPHIIRILVQFDFSRLKFWGDSGRLTSQA